MKSAIGWIMAAFYYYLGDWALRIAEFLEEELFLDNLEGFYEYYQYFMNKSFVWNEWAGVEFWKQN